MKRILLFLLFCSLPAAAQQSAQGEADDFLKFYYSVYQRLYTVDSEAQWKSSTDVSDEHTGMRIGADQANAAFVGSPYIIEESRSLLKRKAELKPMTVRELEKIVYAAAHYPGTIPDVVNARVEAEANQTAVQDGFRFCYDREGDTCAKVVTPNELQEILTTSTDLKERQKAWEVSKQAGPVLKPGLMKLQTLRNKMAQEMGFSSYFTLEVSDYGMSTQEMMKLLDNTIEQVKPLYQQLHYYAKVKLAQKFKQPVPKKIPAHWIGNRWAQEWPGIVDGIDLDEYVKGKSPEWIIQQAEKFYVSLGMPPLPETFWKKSDLYELPADSKRIKNTHASAWHIDLDQDVRSLMSVRPDFDWFQTTHHELGHIYYFLAYSNPGVPLILREGANRAFHEAIGDLIGIAARQVPYLKEIGVMPADAKIDNTKLLLDEAMGSIIFIPWSAGVMSHWEHDFYEQNLPSNEYNARWWKYVAEFQGVEPPAPRGEEYCDAATKTHINDDPAQYYDYTLAFLIKYQLHMYIAKNILKQDPHNCNYYGNKEVGKWLWDLLKQGQTRDWRQVIKEKTGEEISPRAMLEYFKPVADYLKKENKGKNVDWN